MNIAVVAIGLMVGAGLATPHWQQAFARSRTRRPGPASMVVKATTACFSDMVRVAGYLVPRRMAVVNVEADGYKMTEVLVAEGDQVTSGQVLARLTRQAAEGSNAPAGAGGAAGARPATEFAHTTLPGGRPCDAKHRAGPRNGFAPGRAAVPDPGRQRSRARGRNPEHPRGEAQIRRDRADFDCRRRGAGRPGPTGGARYRSEIAARQGAPGGGHRRIAADRDVRPRDHRRQTKLRRRDPAQRGRLRESRAPACAWCATIPSRCGG